MSHKPPERTARAKLRASIAAGEVVFAPLALDALTARIAERAGFSAVYLSGGALGYAHAVSEALLTLTELADTARHIAARTDVALIADGGVGFGDAVHLARTVSEIEATGAAAIEIEVPHSRRLRLRLWPGPARRPCKASGQGRVRGQGPA